MLRSVPKTYGHCTLSLLRLFYTKVMTILFQYLPRYHFSVLVWGKKVNSWDDSCRVSDWCVSKSGDEGRSQDSSGVSKRNNLRINPIEVLDGRTGAVPSFLASCGACVAHDHRPGSKSGVIGSSGDRAGPGRGFSIHLCTLFSGRFRGSWYLFFQRTEERS
jgi:hypothetical protein